jgi:outer membrane lipoprotein-sorting protein
MKKLLSIISFIAFTAVAIAQTPQEIVSRMEAELAKHDESEGIAMTIDIRMIIIGTVTTRVYYLGDKTRIEGKMADKDIISWNDGKTDWSYDSETNEIEIKNATPREKSETEDNMKMFSNITEGYNVSIKKETDTEWYLRCKRSRSNPDKDAPKKMNLVVAKDTYWPVSLSVSMTGIDMTMREISFGVSEKQVTFDAKDYPSATIVDKRQ